MAHCAPFIPISSPGGYIHPSTANVGCGFDGRADASCFVESVSEFAAISSPDAHIHASTANVRCGLDGHANACCFVVGVREFPPISPPDGYIHPSTTDVGNSAFAPISSPGGYFHPSTTNVGCGFDGRAGAGCFVVGVLEFAPIHRTDIFTRQQRTSGAAASCVLHRVSAFSPISSPVGCVHPSTANVACGLDGRAGASCFAASVCCPDLPAGRIYSPIDSGRRVRRGWSCRC